MAQYKRNVTGRNAKNSSELNSMARVRKMGRVSFGTPPFLREFVQPPRPFRLSSQAMHVYLLVLAHAGPGSVERLASFFDVPGFRIGLHVDAKSDSTPFDAIAHRFDHVECITPRVDHLWGDWTMVDVHLNAIRWVSVQEDVSHLVVISADTEPLRSAEAIRDFFAARQGKSVVDGTPWRPVGRMHRHSHTYYSQHLIYLKGKPAYKVDTEDLEKSLVKEVMKIAEQKSNTILKQ